MAFHGSADLYVSRSQRLCLVWWTSWTKHAVGCVVPWAGACSVCFCARHAQEFKPIGTGHNRRAQPFVAASLEDNRQVVSSSYNTPIGLYSAGNIQDALHGQIRGLPHDKPEGWVLTCQPGAQIERPSPTDGSPSAMVLFSCGCYSPLLLQPGLTGN